MGVILPCFDGFAKRNYFKPLRQRRGDLAERKKDKAVLHPGVKAAQHEIRIIEAARVQIDHVAVAQLDLVAMDDPGGYGQRFPGTSSANT
jgi:hypothetical protein